MVERLILGSGSLVQPVVESLRERPGGVRVGTADEQLADRLRETGTDATVLDPTDAGALAALDADVIFVLQDGSADARATARATRRVFPDAYILAAAGTEGAVAGNGTAPGVSDQAGSGDEDLASVADRLFDPGTAVAEHLLERISAGGQRTRRLWKVLQSIDRLAVVTHDNPDPDAIASGIALARIGAAAGCETAVCYFGTISHQENRAFVNVLGLELWNLESAEELADYDGIALVDHARPGVNDRLPAEIAVDVVIDHHPPRGPVDGRFVDLRSDVGATSTLLVEYFDRLGLALEEDVATALLFGIHIDTDSFSRSVVQADFEAAAILLESANLDTLERIEEPSMTPGTIDTLASAIDNRQVEGQYLLSYVGSLTEPDALAQAADRLLELEGINTSVVYGRIDGTINISARSRGEGVDIGETLRDAFDQIGSAGGHVDMGGAQLELDLFEAVDDSNESFRQIVEDTISGRFFDALEGQTGPLSPTTGDTYTSLADKYFVAPPAPAGTGTSGGAGGTGTGGEGESDDTGGDGEDRDGTEQDDGRN